MYLVVLLSCLRRSQSGKQVDEEVRATPKPGADIKLERVPPMSPEQSLASTEVLPGFRMDLVASEPKHYRLRLPWRSTKLGRLYVVEMIDYSEKDKARLGRIRLLSDEDGDGHSKRARCLPTICLGRRRLPVTMAECSSATLPIYCISKTPTATAKPTCER